MFEEVFVGVQNDIHLEYIERLEVLAGPTGRRRWPDEVKGRLVVETMVPGVSVREVAERNGLQPNHLSTWRGLARQGKLVVPELAGADFTSATTMVKFADVVLSDAKSAAIGLAPIELETGSVTLRLDANTGMGQIAELILALKAGP